MFIFFEALDHHSRPADAGQPVIGPNKTLSACLKGKSGRQKIPDNRPDASGFLQPKNRHKNHVSVPIVIGGATCLPWETAPLAIGAVKYSAHAPTSQQATRPANPQQNT